MMTGEWLGSVFQEYCLEGDKTGEMWGGWRERKGEDHWGSKGDSAPLHFDSVEQWLWTRNSSFPLSHSCDAFVAFIKYFLVYPCFLGCVWGCKQRYNHIEMACSFSVKCFLLFSLGVANPPHKCIQGTEKPQQKSKIFCTHFLTPCPCCLG